MRRQSCIKTNGALCSSRIMGEYQVAIGQTHIHVRYFLIKDGISVGDLKVKYCPTEKMFADHFTKPLLGDA